MWRWQLAHECDALVLGELLADRRRAADVGLDRADARRRRLDGPADDVLQHPRAADDGRRVRAVGGDLQHARLRQHAAPRRFGRQLDAAELLPRDARDAVVLGQALVEDRPVGVHEIGQRQIFLQHFAEEAVRLLQHRVAEHLVELGILPHVGLGEVDVAQVEPLAGEVLARTAADLASWSIRSTCWRSTSGSRSLPAAARASSSSSGSELHRKYDSRVASAWLRDRRASSAGSSRNRNSGEQSSACKPTRRAGMNGRP